MIKLEIRLYKKEDVIGLMITKFIFQKYFYFIENCIEI